MAGEALPRPDATLDGGELDCGSGLLLLIRNALEPLAAGGVLLVTSREGSVKEDLPAWCRMVGHALLATDAAGAAGTGFWLQKKGADATLAGDLARARDFTWSTRTRWKQGLESRVTVRNHELAVGQPASFDTRDAAPAALELLLAAVGGALSAGLAWRLSREGLALRALEVVVKARSRNILQFLGLGGDGHSGLAALDVQVYLDSDGDEPHLATLVRETVERCPVTNSLVHGAPVEVQWRSL
ncbi:MAG: OsmC family protein [Planctomycetota bacterium]